MMFGFLSLERKTFEVFGGGGGAFPFGVRVTKFSRWKRFFVKFKGISLVGSRMGSVLLL